jgi:hypothetical protein
VSDVPVESLDYANAFALLQALTRLVDDLTCSGGTPEAITHYVNTAVDLARRLSGLHPEEPHYQRALARNLLQRAVLFPATPAAIDDVRGAVAAIERLVDDEPLPWRLDEARGHCCIRGDRVEAATLLA